MKKYFTLILVTVLAIFGVITFNQTAGAADMSKFNAGNIMSDYVMSNKNSMTEVQIQQFLTDKNPCNDTNTAKAAQYPSMTYNIKDGKFVCLSKEMFNGETAAKIIWQAAQDYNINPQVLIVLLQKEQGLVTDTWPNHNVQYRSATGYGCPDNADCSSKYYGFKNQVRNAANFFRAHLDNNSGWYKPHVPGGQNVRWSPNTSCGAGWVNIDNRATSGLYSYTPYQPNGAALRAGYGTGDDCSAYGNRNFWAYFNDWFSSTQGLIYKEISFSSLFDYEYYLNTYPDLKAVIPYNIDSAFNHFVNYGFAENRQINESFNIISYFNKYPDLRAAFGNDLIKYYAHYMSTGVKEGRVAVGTTELEAKTTHEKMDYSSVYNFTFYQNKYDDLRNTFAVNDTATILHFINYGMIEGRQASADFNVHSYKNRYPDLRAAFGGNLKQYYLHYITYGKKEGRIATGNEFVGVSHLKSTDYSSIYDYNFYSNNHSDIKTVFGLNDTGTLDHFINYGMIEGRQASADFNVHSYKNRYPDLRAAFGGNLKQYYLHYITYGKKEGRIAN